MRSGQSQHTARNVIGRRRGAALVLVIGVMFILMALGTGSLYYGFLNRILATRDGQQIMARAAADAGLKKAVLAMQSYAGGPLPSVTEEALPGCMASYSYTVTQNPDRTYSVTSTGTSGTAVRTVSSRLKASSSLWSGVMLETSVVLAFTSRIGPVIPGETLRVRTNSVAAYGVLLTFHSSIPGDVAVGPGGNPATVIYADAGSSVTGTKSAAAQALSFPAVVPPSGLPNQGNATITSSQVISSSRQYSNLTIQGAQVQIQGNITIYVTGNVTITPSAQLLVQDGSCLTMYVGGIFNQMGGTIKEVNLRPEKLQIYGTSTCALISFSFGATAYAAIYAPAALCSVSSSMVTGTFSGGALALTADGYLYYNPSVDGQCLYGANVYVIDRWWEN